MTSEPIILSAPGAALSGDLFRPVGAMRAAAVIHAATGVPARFYRHFAAWLAAHGVLALTYDYRDFAASAHGPARESAVDMVSWGLEDQQTALARLVAEAGRTPLWAIGHSLGGLTTSFHADAPKLSRLIGVCSGPAHWARHGPVFGPQVLAFWWGIGPLGVAATGALPRWTLGLGGDIPPGVFRQWRRWCTSRGFFERDLGPPPARFTGDLRIVTLSDDQMVPPSVARDLARLHPGAASVTVEEIDPRAHGLAKVGHTRIFARENAALWPLVIGEA